MNSAKLFIILNQGFLLETLQGNFVLTDAYVLKTNLTSDGLEETAFDITTQGVMDNAKLNAPKLLSEEEISMLNLLFTEKSEDFDGPVV